MSDIINILVASWHDEERSNILTALSGQNDFFIASVEKDEVGVIIKSERLKPDVVIIDLHSPFGMDGPELASIVRRKSPSSFIIMMCDKDDNVYAAKAFKAGVTGFLLRKIDMDKLVYAIKIVNLGGVFVSASITMRALDTITFYNQFPGQLKIITSTRNSAPLSLSPAERGILTDIAKGLSDNEIAEHLNYSAGTIRNILVNIKRKTKLKNRVQIVLFSLISGIINLDLKDLLKLKLIDNSPKITYNNKKPIRRSYHANCLRN